MSSSFGSSVGIPAGSESRPGRSPNTRRLPGGPYALPHLLEQSASVAPERLAVESKMGTLTYRELNERSNRLAHVLRQHGVGTGDRVGFLLPKTPEAVVAVYGIMKSGAAYVPLDPAAPDARTAFIVGNCAMKALVTSRKGLQGLADFADGWSMEVAVLVDGDGTPGPGGLRTLGWSDIEEGAADPPDSGVIEQDLAYILYTSGSTGEPKGVMISHRAALTFAAWAGDTIGVTARDRLSQHAPMHFDLSTFDMFAAARAGATLVLVPRSLSVFPRSLADFIETQGITIWYSVPSILTQMLLHGELGRHGFERLRAVIFAGEVFPTKYLRRLMEAIPHAEYHNWYGPTETNVCTWYRVDDLPADQTEPIPIGRACANSEVFAVTDEGRLAGVGEEGELYVRGPTLMEGYWGLPERTRTVLVPHPLGGHGARPVYRTGDLVKLDSDGDYRFLGRRDNMIKSRGYRIELGEIETALYSHEDVVEAAVLAIPDEEIGNVIKAVVVLRGGCGIGSPELEYHCAQKIPRYMVPGIIELRDTLPKTSTGKVDRPFLVRQHVEAAEPATNQETSERGQ